MRGTAATLTAALLLVTAAPAAAKWRTPRELSRDGQGGTSPTLLFDAGGVGLAAWQDLPRKWTALLSGSSRAANKALNVQPGGSGAYGNGRLLTLEQTTDHPNRNPPGNRLYLRGGDFKGSLGKRVLLTSTGRIDSRWISVAPNGDALIAWTSFPRTGSRAHSVWVVERRGGRLSKPTRLAAAGAETVTAVLAGKTELVAWRHGDAMQARYRHGGKWSKTADFGTDGHGDTPSVAATSAGRLLVAWRSDDIKCDDGGCDFGPGTVVVKSAFGGTTHGFEPVAKLDTYEDNGTLVRAQTGPVLAALDDNERPFVAWSAPDGTGHFRVHVNRGAVPLSPDGIDSPLEGLAAGHDVTVAWTNHDDGLLWAARGNASSFGDPDKVSRNPIAGVDRDSAEVQLAYPPGKDNPVALWADSSFGILTAAAR